MTTDTPAGTDGAMTTDTPERTRHAVRGYHEARFRRAAYDGTGPDMARPPAALSARRAERAKLYRSPPAMALTSSPLAVSPLVSQKKAPPRPWFLA